MKGGALIDAVIRFVKNHKCSKYVRDLDLAGKFEPDLLSLFFGELTALQTLSLGGCTALVPLPESLGNLTALRDLFRRRCQAVTALPDSKTAGLSSSQLTSSKLIVTSS